MGQQVLLPSATRTTQQICPLPDPQLAGYRGFILYLNITAITTGGLNVRVRYTDPVSGTVLDSQIGSARTATGMYVCQAGPDANLAALNGGSLNAYIPSTNPAIVIATNDGSAITYSLAIDYR